MNSNKAIATCCKSCGKSYTRKSSLERHEILCEIMLKSRNKRQNEIEKDENNGVLKSRVSKLDDRLQTDIDDVGTNVYNYGNTKKPK